MQLIAFFVVATIITSLCFYLGGYSAWWFLGIPAAMGVLYAFYNISKLVFYLLIFDISAYLYGVSLWWVLGVPAGFIAISILLLGILSCYYQDMDKRSYRRTINERSPLLPSYVSRPPAETPKRIVSSYSSYTSRSPIYATPRALPTQPSTLPRTVVDARLPGDTTRIYPSAAAVNASSLYANSPSGSSTTVAGKPLVRVERNSIQPARKVPANIPRSEVDGMLLHASVAAEVENRYKYDQQLKIDSAHKSSTLFVIGVFKCYSCKRKKGRLEEPHKWNSSRICVEIWMSSTGQYRTQLNSQLCGCCRSVVEPEVDKDHYVTKVVRMLDRWTGQHSVVKPLQYPFSTGPHQTDKCNGCRKGICHQKPTK